MDKNNKVSLDEIENSFKEKSWWSVVANLKIAKYLTYLIANYTKWTPNLLTAISLLFAIFSGVAFFYDYYVLGAILYQISYIFDIADGSLARVKNLHSKIGAFFDVFTDWLKAPILITILLYKDGEIIFLISIILLLFLNCSMNRYNDMLFFTTKSSLSKSKKIQSSLIGKYLNYMKKIKMVPFPAVIEFEALTLFLYPIFKLDIFLYIAILILIFNFAIKFYVVLKKIK